MGERDNGLCMSDVVVTGLSIDEPVYVPNEDEQDLTDEELLDRASGAITAEDSRFELPELYVDPPREGRNFTVVRPHWIYIKHHETDDPYEFLLDALSIERKEVSEMIVTSVKGRASESEPIHADLT